MLVELCDRPLFSSNAQVEPQTKSVFLFSWHYTGYHLASYYLAIKSLVVISNNNKKETMVGKHIK